jgi:branched-chain amino acid aminotransferase
MLLPGCGTSNFPPSREVPPKMKESAAMASLADPVLPFNTLPLTTSVGVAEREAVLANPGFGTQFSEHMVTIDWTEGRGWHDATLGPRQPIALDPACAVLHYAQEIFEGLKAYRHPDGSIALFRPYENATRFNRSAARLAMPSLPEDVFVDSVRRLVEADREWLPGVEGGALYLRPFMFASEVFLGVRPAKQYKYIVIASPSGNYFKSGAPAVSIWVSEGYTRAAPGGTGAAKCGGNYAASLLAQAEATRHGCDQVVFLDAIERRWIEELGGMNIFFVFADGSIATPPTSGTILAGVTRDSILRMARDEGMTVREEPYAFDQWQADAQSGRLTESFACGTAAVVTPIGKVSAPGTTFAIGAGGAGALTTRIKQQLTDIQFGRAPDPYGWRQLLD